MNYFDSGYAQGGYTLCEQKRYKLRTNTNITKDSVMDRMFSSVGNEG
jgi:hypothetical protein